MFSNHRKYWLDETRVLNHLLKKIGQIISQFKDPNKVVFSSTDSYKIPKHLIKHTDAVVYQTLSPEEDHTNVERHLKRGYLDAESTLIEMFLLSKCDYLIRYPSSWFSYFASLYVKKTFDLALDQELNLLLNEES